MNYKIIIKDIENVDEITGHWTPDDYMELLKKFGFPDADRAKKEELKDLLYMAITDFDANESAAILLEYKLSEQLSEGQIQQLSHEMIEDKVSEEYPDISLHAELFHINQLLYKAYNGKFPHAKASIIEFSMVPTSDDEDMEVTKETVLKAFGKGLTERSLMKRLLEDQLNGEVEFPDAGSILWELHALGNDQYKAITSEYWLNSEDFGAMEFEGEVVEFVKEEE